MRKCQICGKTKNKAVKRKKLRGKFNPVKTYFQKANLQLITFNDKKILVCQDCRRSILKGKEGC